MRIQSKKTSPAEVDMTPMIDIVFQLIAFFMVVINFEQTQADERVKLPKDELARPPEVARDEPRVFNIGFIRNSQGEILSDPLCFYDARDVKKHPDGVPVLAMGPYLQRESRLLKRDAKLKDTTVVIRADRETQTGLIQEFIKLAQEAEFTRFAMSATQKIDQ